MQKISIVIPVYNEEGNIIGDTNILNLDQSVFSKSDTVIEENIDGSNQENKKKTEEYLKDKSSRDHSLIRETILKKYQNDPIVLEEETNNNFFVNCSLS